ncbi:hypothetical protein Jab_2c34670 [Janthinobacterium sp. HH01]|nr:hypothetical protein Jab_2c34670 [Janthinobacterium sp. HH01]
MTHWRRVRPPRKNSSRTHAYLPHQKPLVKQCLHILHMEKSMTLKHCAGCGQAFQPRPQAPKQTFCSAPACQRIRKRQWQQSKLQSDPDYRSNQRQAQRTWQESHPDYWRQYRGLHLKYAQRGQDPQRAGPFSNTDGVKMDAWISASTLVPGLYKIAPARVSGISSGGSLIVEITPVCLDCLCKMDACKERTR